MNRWGSTPIPDWALPYVGGALFLVALFLLWRAVRTLKVPSADRRTRIGGAVGYLGLTILFGTMGAVFAFDLSFNASVLTVFGFALLFVLVGGSFARWHR